jgi:molecular chaperone IbpA
MRTTLDFSPFYRSSVGFDRLFSLLEESARLGSPARAPAYDIVRTGEDGYRISIAVPGFSLNDIEISQQPNLLVVSGKAVERESADYLHRSIETGSFSHRFELADYVEVTAANLVDGLLTIELKRELPETMKPRRIEIGAGPAAGAQKQLESRKAA